MALHGDAALVMFYDISGDTSDHDHWHTYEHMPERLAISGFLRGTRWIAQIGSPRYLVIYEVGGVGVSTSASYLTRLNNPTPWTATMMPRFRGMARGVCIVSASSGLGLGQAAVSIRFSPAPGREAELREWVARQVLPSISSRPGLASAHLLERAVRAPITKEQAMRGQDADISWILFVTGYSSDAVASISNEEFGVQSFETHGSSPGIVKGTYSLQFSLTERETARSAPNLLRK